MAELRLLALGDSYTIGEGVAPAEAWPSRLARALTAHDHPCAGPTVIATTGWTTDELQAALAQASLAPPYDLVTLMIGVNDQYRWRPIDAFVQGFAPLLEDAIALAGGRAARVLGISIPDWSVTPFARGDTRSPQHIGETIDAFNTLARDRVLVRGARWADVTACSRRAGSGPGQLVGDGLHPGPAQYATWVDEALLPATLEMLA